MESFTEFSFQSLSMDEQTFADYRSKYLDLYDKVRANHEKEKVSILDDLDFELELIRCDTINVGYIIALLNDLRNAAPSVQEAHRKAIMDILGSEAQLRSKKELIEEFIDKHFSNIDNGSDIKVEFDEYWSHKKQQAVEELSQSEGMDLEGLKKIISQYLFTEKLPLRDEVISTLRERPKLKDRSSLSKRILQKIQSFVETFIDNVD